MSKGEIRMGDVGTPFEMQIKDQNGAIVDISGASTKKLIFIKPDETKAEEDADFTTDGKDGKMYYASETSFLDQTGDWSWQAYVVLSSGSWKSDIRHFKVYGNL